uniref:Integrase catalytic domain-containing protein n=1 Tax=Tanacetum cinerariifolium TaxID=118510 RepID=A0A6L2N234_TANCI|nr:hypothetical protein [Tanacetum cinerariifolium]
MSRNVLTVGSTMRILLLYRGEYSKWVERFMNYLEEQTDKEAMINSIKNGDQPLPRATQVSIAGTSSIEQSPLKDKSMWFDQEKNIQKIDRLARSLLSQGLLNDIYSLIDSNKTAKDLWDALARYMLGSEYGEQDRKATKNQGDVNDAMRLKKKNVVVTSDPLAFIAEKPRMSKRKEKVVVSSNSEGSDVYDFSELKKITDLLAKEFNRRKFYSKPTNNNLRTSFASQSANKKQEYVKLDDKKVEKKADEKKQDMTKMLLAKKDKDEQVRLAENQAWMESSSDSDQEINENMVFMAQIEKVLSDSETSSSSADDKISEVSYYISESKSESEYETSKYYDNTTTYGLFVNDNDDQEIFHDCENFPKNLIESQINHNESAVDHNDSEGIDKKKIADQEVLYNKMIVQLVELDKHVRDLKNMVLEKDFKISELEEYLDTCSSVRRPKQSSVIWKKKGSSNTSNVDLSSVSHSKLNKDVKRYSRKDLLSCNNFHLGETSSAYVCNDTMNVSCNSRLCDSFDENNLFIFDDESVTISPVSKIPFRKKSRDSLNVRSRHEASDVIISFIKKTQVNHQLQVQRVRTDNGTEFKNKTLAKFFDVVGITQQFSAARTPQQNGIVERRNRTLVKAARTMHTFIMKISTTNVETSNVEIPLNEEKVFHESFESFQEESSSSSLNDDVQQSPEEVILPQTNTQSILNKMIPNVDEASTSHNVFNERLEDAYFDDRPLYKIIGDLKLSVRTRGQLANSCLFSCLLSSIETANVAEALRGADWVSAMQEELDQFARLKTKWIFKNKKDESSLMDVKTMFLNGIHKEEVYVGQPLGFVSKQYPDHVYALDKALYGLKQAHRAWIFINQSKYILDILKRFGMENCDTVPTPMVEQAKLKLVLVGKPVDHIEYRSMIGSLMYFTSSRPDIMFATSMCARYQANSNEHHVSAIKMIFQYLKGTINLGLWYPKDFSFDLTAYSDADHTGCHLDRKTKSEYVAVSRCCAQVLWMRTQLTDYGFFYDKVPIYCDSKSTIAISCNPVQHTRTKHIDVRGSVFTMIENFQKSNFLIHMMLLRMMKTEKRDIHSKGLILAYVDGATRSSSRTKILYKIVKDSSCSKESQIAFENADSSSRLELVPSKIKYANKVVLNFHKEFSVFSSFKEKEMTDYFRITCSRIRKKSSSKIPNENSFQFWSTVVAKTINGEAQLHAHVDGKKIIITEASIRIDLQLADEEGVDCLPNSTIFKQLSLMGDPMEHVVDEAVHKELGDSLVRAATTTSSLEARQWVLELEKTKTSQHNEIDSLKRTVKKLKKKIRRIEAINVDEDITLVNDQDDADMFDVNNLGGEEVFVTEQEVAKYVNENVVEEEQEEPGKSTTTTAILSKQQSQDKGKRIMTEEHVKPKKKDQIRLDEEATKMLQAKFDEEERLARKRAQKEQEAKLP